MSGQGPSELYLSPDEQDLLVAALNSNQPGGRGSDSLNPSYTPTTQANPESGQLDYSDDSPYLDFDPDGEFDDSAFSFDPNSRMIGDLPDEHPLGSDLHEKRKSIGDKDDDDEGGGKRREGEDKTSKKPGRKPLTSEPTSKRKAQNRAAQRAFRERKERHLKDLETKVEDLEKASDAANHENGLLRAQVERLQVELKEYRKRLSWISSNGVGRSQNSPSQPRNSIGGQNDFQFEFPKFGDLPAMSATNMFNNKPQGTNTTRSATLPAQSNGSASRAPNQSSDSRSSSAGQVRGHGSQSQSPLAKTHTASPPQQNLSTSVDSLTGLFSPSILEASRHASLGGYFPNGPNAAQKARSSLDSGNAYSSSSISNTDSPSSSSESHNAISSIGTSPEPSLNSPGNKLQDLGLNTINEENQFGFGLGNTNTFGSNSDITWMANQNNGSFDPVLFGDYRETQDNILSQDFGTFFNDAYPLPDLGSPLHNYTEVASEAPKVDLIRQVDAAKEGEEVVPDNDKPMTCNKIWDRLQSMEKFRNGEIDIDNLCSELRAKAKCSEGGAVVDKKDVDKILGSAK